MAQLLSRIQSPIYGLANVLNAPIAGLARALQAWRNRGRRSEADLMATAARHGELSDTLLEQAEAEFERGDLLQASERLGGHLPTTSSPSPGNGAGGTGRTRTYGTLHRS